MSAEAAVRAGRRAIEALMIDTCRVTAPGVGTGPFNEATGQYDAPPRIVVYGPGAVDSNGDPVTDPEILSGKCRIQVRSDINSNAVEAVVGDHESTYRTGTMQLPIVGTGRIKPDYVAEHLSCPLDPSLVGRLYNLQAETKGKTHATHRRFRMREVLS